MTIKFVLSAEGTSLRTLVNLKLKIRNSSCSPSHMLESPEDSEFHQLCRLIAILLDLLTTILDFFVLRQV
jgi:hypothetical protein